MTDQQVDIAPHSQAAGQTAACELVVAVAQNDVIGRGNALPWHLPADLKHFKSLTLGNTVLMGRKTYQSIGKALPGRTNLVLTRSAFAPGDCRAVASLSAAQAATGAGMLMVIGGAEVYSLALPYVTRMHLTLVHTRIEDGDAYFSAWRDPQWHTVAREEHAADAKNAFDYTYLTLERAARVIAA